MQSLVEKYRSLDPAAVIGHNNNTLIVDRIVFDGKHRASPHRRYQLLDLAEQVVGYARSKALAFQLMNLMGQQLAMAA